MLDVGFENQHPHCLPVKQPLQLLSLGGQLGAKKGGHFGA
jgi:hypothetical protein